MEETYSVSTNNRFALFMADEDDSGDFDVQDNKTPREEASPDAKKSPADAKKQDKSVKSSNKDSKEKVQAQQTKKSPKEPAGKKRDPAPVTEKSPASKERTGASSSSGGGYKGGQREGRRPPPNDRPAGDNRPPRQQFNRGNRPRLPSKENQEGQSSSGGGYDDSYGNRENRFGRGGDRPRERGERNNEKGDFDRGTRQFQRGGRGGFRGGKRDFDRRSGSDKSSVKPVDKREGAGAHNWGSMKDDIENTPNEWPSEDVEQTNAATTPKEDQQQTESPEQQSNTEKPEAEDGEEKEEKEGEEEVPTLTLDEYKALQEKKRSIHEFNERKAGENEDQTKWKDTFVYSREDEEFFAGTKEIIEKYKTSGRTKTAVESNFYIKRGDSGPSRGRGDGSSRGRGGFRGGGGDRGGFSGRRGDDERPRYNSREERGRGGRGRGGGNSARGDRFNFNVEDEKDFPSLGTVSA